MVVRYTPHICTTTLRRITPRIESSLNHLGVLYPNNSGTIDMQNGIKYYTWSSNATGYLTTVLTQDVAFNESLYYFHQFIQDKNKRDLGAPSGEWVSFNSYGLNVDTANIVTNNMNTDAMDVYQGYDDLMDGQVQPCTTSYECYFVNSKMCMAAGQSSEVRVNSDIVGEIYGRDYGGIDSECQSG
ncbi:hypothetical protein V1523DRAFT_182969 [Lipomyces doorenjongii]